MKKAPRLKLVPGLRPDQVARLMSVEGGVPVLRKAPPAPDPKLLHPGQLIKALGGIWQVEHRGPGSATLRCVQGPRAGRTEQWSPSSVGHRFVTAEALEAARLAEAEAKVRAGDERQCPRCWAGEDDAAGRGRDPHCLDHQVRAEEVQRRASGVPKSRRAEDPATVAEVLRLRASGLKYSEIESKMGWPDQHGARPWRIVKQAGAPAEKAS